MSEEKILIELTREQAYTISYALPGMVATLAAGLTTEQVALAYMREHGKWTDTADEVTGEPTYIFGWWVRDAEHQHEVEAEEKRIRDEYQAQRIRQREAEREMDVKEWALKNGYVEKVAKEWAEANGMVMVPRHEHDWREDNSGGKTDWWCGRCGAVRSKVPGEEGKR